MHRRGDDAPPRRPGCAVANEQAVTQKRPQRMSHLRRFAFETVVTVDEGLGDGIRTVADEYRPRQHSGRKELVLESRFLPDREKVPARGAQRRQGGQRLARAFRKRRDEFAHALRYVSYSPTVAEAYYRSLHSARPVVH